MNYTLCYVLIRRCKPTLAAFSMTPNILGSTARAADALAQAKPHKVRDRLPGVWQDDLGRETTGRLKDGGPGDVRELPMSELGPRTGPIGVGRLPGKGGSAKYYGALVPNDKHARTAL